MPKLDKTTLDKIRDMENEMIAFHNATSEKENVRLSWTNNPSRGAFTAHLYDREQPANLDDIVMWFYNVGDNDKGLEQMKQKMEEWKNRYAVD